MTDLIARLRQVPGIYGYEAADELDRLNADVATLRSEVKGLHETSNTLHMDRDRLNAQALELCAEISGLRRENERLREALALAGDYAEANQGGWCREGAGSNTVLRHIREALAGAAVQPPAALDEGWKRYYELRRQVAEGVYPGMTAIVRAADPTSGGHSADPA